MTTIFVVDDNPRHADLTALVVRKLGHAENLKVKVFTDPLVALGEAESDPPDLLLVDFMMPIMDGITLVREMRKHGVESKAIFISAYGLKVSSKLLPSNGVLAVLEKPCPAEKLGEIVNEALPA